MAYTVLARRYRSQSFDDVVGQDAVAHTLKNAIKTGRVAHAYLFSGTRGVGKTTMARILAKALNCQEVDEPTVEPCCKCESCVAINQGEDIDVIEIDGASNTGVDNIRELRQNAIYRPARARYKVYIIDEVHMLSVAAFNALLKILEEPPEHVKFIFATTEPNKVLPTIQSRCQRFDFCAITPNDIAKQLKMILASEAITYKDDLVLHIARLANGSMRDSLSLLDQLISAGSEPLTVELLEEFMGEPNRQKICDLIENIGDNSPEGVLMGIDDLLKNGQTPAQVADSLVDCMRDLMIVKSTNPNSELVILTDQERKIMGGLAEKFDIAGLVYNITTLEKLRWTIKNSESARALLEASMLRLTLSEHFMSVPALLNQLKNAPRTTASPAGSDRFKKKTVAPSGNSTPSQAQPEPVRQVAAVLDADVSIDSIKQNWLQITEAVKDGDAKTAVPLEFAVPGKWSGGTLTLHFPKSQPFAIERCKSLAGKMTPLLSAAIGTKLQLKFEAADIDAIQTPRPIQAPAGAKTSSKKREEILKDPAVKLIMQQLQAKPTEIEEVN